MLGYKNKIYNNNNNNINKLLCDVLHIQSISNWAPSNIGPYSQATKLLNSIVFPAGQIGFIPNLMILYDNIKQPKKQIIQTFNNMKYVLLEMDSNIINSIHNNIFILDQPSCNNKHNNTNIDSDIDNYDEYKSNNNDNNNNTLLDNNNTLLNNNNSLLWDIVQDITYDYLNKRNNNNNNNNIPCTNIILSIGNLPYNALIELQTISITNKCILLFKNLTSLILKNPLILNSYKNILYSDSYTSGGGTTSGNDSTTSSGMSGSSGISDNDHDQDSSTGTPGTGTGTGSELSESDIDHNNNNKLTISPNFKKKNKIKIFTHT